MSSKGKDKSVANILLGVTGSVAAIYTPDLVADLRAAGYAVKVVATRSALYFFDATRLDNLIGHPHWSSECIYDQTVSLISILAYKIHSKRAQKGYAVYNTDWAVI